MPLELFYSYAHEDEPLRKQLNKHLSALEREGLIVGWHDRNIGAGGEWRDQIDEHLQSAQIILFLVSADFIASDYCYDVEVREALERHDRHEAVVIPVILRSVDWSRTPFSKLQALPRNVKPVTSWANQDEAFTDIARGIREVVARYQTTSAVPSTIPQRSKLKDTRVNKDRVLDAAIPSHIVKDLAAELLVQIHLPDSPGLKGVLQLEAEHEASPEDVRSKQFGVIFPLGPDGRPEQLKTTIRLDSPDFVPPKQAKNLYIPPDKDSDVVDFLLTPRRAGRLRVLVELQWEDALRGSRSLRTECVAEATSLPAQTQMNLVRILLSAPGATVQEPANQDKEDNRGKAEGHDKAKGEDKEKTPFSAVWDLGHKIYLAFTRWSSLTPEDRIDVLLVLAFGISGLLLIGKFVPWFLRSTIYRSPWLTFWAAVVAIISLCLLGWRFRPGRQTATPIPPRARVLIAILVLVLVCAAALVFRHFLIETQVKIDGFHNQLKNSGLPPDLYDRQGQLESLTIRQEGVRDLDWLDSDSLTEFTIASSKLNSLTGLTGAPKLQSLEVDLREVPLKSLSTVSALHGLQTLVLRNIGRAKNQLVPQIVNFPSLKILDLDFERPSASKLPELKALPLPELKALPELKGCPELQDLRLNVRSTKAIADLPDVSQLKQLHSVTLFLDTSNVGSLKALARAEHLQTLTLSLDGSQLHLLSDLNDSPGIPSLTLILTSPLNGPLPDLRGIQNLIALTLQMPEARSINLPDKKNPDKKTPVVDKMRIPDITYLRNLQWLALSLKGLDVEGPLPEIGQLNQLRSLDLNFEGSSVQQLPDISPLNNHLETLALNLTGTRVSELPNFAQSSTPFPKLTELNLKLASTQISSLRGIERLGNPNTLELDVRGTKIRDLDPIAKLSSLQKLVLYLDWTQDLPDLSLLKNLETLELHIDAYRPDERLPRFSNLEKLTTLKLVVEASDIEDWTPLEHLNKLVNLELDLSGSKRIPSALHSCKQLGRVAADLRHTGANLGQTGNLCALQELKIEPSFPSLEGLPPSVRKLVLVP